MPIFTYIALDNNNNPVNGTIDQPDRASAINAITRQNLKPISIKENKSTSNNAKIGGAISGKLKKVKPDQLVMFTRQLSAMVGAGVPLLRALTALAGHIDNSPTLQQILNNVIHDVEVGSSLADALEKYPDTFSEVYTNMVRAGEAAGILDDILKRLAMQQEKNTALRKRIRSAMAYPMVLISITVIAFFGLMIFIVPQIGNVVVEMSGGESDLPTLTKVMLSISGFVTSYWYIIIIATVLIVMAVVFYTRTPKGRYQKDLLLLKIPLIKVLFTKVAIARFSRTYSALIEAGVSVLEALSVTAKAVGNVVYKKALEDAEKEVKNGKMLSSIISSNPYFPPIVSQMLSVGEETGQTDQILVKVADFYEEEVDITVNSLSTIIEPVMIVILGAIVGLIAASVMLPIAGLAQSIQ